MKKHSGFTLIEILIALFIFAIIGVLAAMSLQSIIRTHRQLKIANRQLSEIQMSMTLLRRDLMQVIDRPIRDADGNQEASFTADGGDQLSFTRTGLINPFNSAPQSDMQRVSYQLQGGNLVRLTWNALDQPPHSKAENQIVLHNVTSVKWQFIAGNGSKSDGWPPAVGSNMQKETSDLPKVVLLVMKVKDKGIIQGVYPIVARGLNATIPSSP